MNKFIKYNIPFKDTNITLIGRDGDKSDQDIISLVFLSQMFATTRFTEHDKALQKYFKYLKRNKGHFPVIIDAGANIGTASLYFSLIYDESKIYSIEPDQDNFQMLTTNMSINNKSFIGLQGALSSKNGFTFLNTIDFGTISFRTGDSGDVKVNAFGLTQIFDNLPSNEHPFILKIDIEGAESEVFSINSSFLSRIPLVIMEPHDWMIPFKSSSKNFYNEISKHNFDILMYGENIFCFNVDILKDFS